MINKISKKVDNIKDLKLSYCIKKMVLTSPKMITYGMDYQEAMQWAADCENGIDEWCEIAKCMISGFKIFFRYDNKWNLVRNANGIVSQFSSITLFELASNGKPKRSEAAIIKRAVDIYENSSSITIPLALHLGGGLSELADRECVFPIIGD